MSSDASLAASTTVAVVVPAYNRAQFTADEEISFRHIEHYLGSYHKYLLVPQSLVIDRPGFVLKRFDDRFFGSATASARLMLSAGFYEAFARYRYVLICHLDALVLSDKLLEWCEAGFDYIASPWLKCDDSPWVTRARVGNGGFSLRKVDSFLKVLGSDQFWVDPDDYWADFCRENPWYRQYLSLPRRFLMRVRLFNNVKREIAHWHLKTDGRGNEDYFWSDEAARCDPNFRVAPFEVGLRFAFEVAPRKCFELNHGQLPFGCHAWQRYDRAFWEPYLLKP